MKVFESNDKNNNHKNKNSNLNTDDLEDLLASQFFNEVLLKENSNGKIYVGRREIMNAREKGETILPLPINYIIDDEEGRCSDIIRERLYLHTEVDGSPIPVLIAYSSSLSLSLKTNNKNINTNNVKVVKQKMPILILNHATGSSSQDLWKEGLIQRFVKLGYFVVSMDNRYHGLRIDDNEIPLGKTKLDLYNEAILNAYLEKGDNYEMPFIYDNVWDIFILTNYLVDNRSEIIEKSKIIEIGISLGGMIANYHAFFDKRVKITLPFIAVQSFGWGITNGKYQARCESIPLVFNKAAELHGKSKYDEIIVTEVYNKINPGLINKYDGEKIISSFFPRYFMGLNGKIDQRNPEMGVKMIKKICEMLYDNNNNNNNNEINRFHIKLFDGVGHDVTESMWKMGINFIENAVKDEKSISSNL